MCHSLVLLACYDQVHHRSSDIQSASTNKGSETAGRTCPVAIFEVSSFVQ